MSSPAEICANKIHNILSSSGDSEVLISHISILPELMNLDPEGLAKLCVLFCDDPHVNTVIQGVVLFSITLGARIMTRGGDEKIK